MLFTKDFGELYMHFTYEFSEKEDKISYSSVYSNNYEVDFIDKKITMWYNLNGILMLEDKCFIPNVDENYDGINLGVNRGSGVIQINDKDKFYIRKINIFIYARDNSSDMKVKVVYSYLKDM